MARLLILGALATALASSVLAGPPVPAEDATGVAEWAHGGGCRKSSPPGQCCHAGSKPLHCH